MKTTVIHHSADYDGIFCREIARKFLPEAELIGWDFKDKPVTIPDGQIYILDLPVDRVFDLTFAAYAEHAPLLNRIIWIDHHKSSIESHPMTIPGYRIDGVAACRLAWQWFSINDWNKSNLVQDQPHQRLELPRKNEYFERFVNEPLAIRLAGEYDIWDKRDPRADIFQFGLRSQDLTPTDWEILLQDCPPSELFVDRLLEQGTMLQRYQQRNDAGMMYRSFLLQFEGLKFLTLTTARCNSLTFASRDIPETGHDALMGFYFDGQKWNVSLYHAKHRTDLDLSAIAVKFGGGGHRGACGFATSKLPFLP